MKDLYSNVGIDAAVVPATLTATNTSAAIDLQGFESAMVIIQTGAIGGAGNFTPKLTECATSGGTYTDVAAADLNGIFPAVLAASSIYRVGYRGSKRFIKTVLTLNSGTNILAGAMIVKGDPANGPVA
jgi:hypothetical protein